MRTTGAGRKPRRWKRWLLWLLLAPLLVSVLQVLVLRVVDPPFTSFMAIRQLQGWLHGDAGFGIRYQWRDPERIAPCMPLAVIAAEDQTFPSHHGFDLRAIERAAASNERGRKLRGGSTISQQLAKNLFLWSGRSWLRKGIEAWYTVLIETLWPKRRILAMYVNVVEFGDGTYGVQAAARRAFGTDAARLTTAQCARLAAVLPSPRRYNAARPGPYVQRRANAIQRQMAQLGGTGFLREVDWP